MTGERYEARRYRGSGLAYGIWDRTARRWTDPPPVRAWKLSRACALTIARHLNEGTPLNGETPAR